LEIRSLISGTPVYAVLNTPAAPACRWWCREGLERRRLQRLVIYEKRIAHDGGLHVLNIRNIGVKTKLAA
jgi:hypothetical protein